MLLLFTAFSLCTTEMCMPYWKSMFMLGKQHTEVFVYDYMTIPHSINTMRCKKKYSKVSSIKGCSLPACKREILYLAQWGIQN
jgi:hypothetical protein